MQSRSGISRSCHGANEVLPQTPFNFFDSLLESPIFAMTRDSDHNTSPSQIPLINLSSETERINTDIDHQHGRKPLHWFGLSTLRRLIFRFRYSRVGDYTSRGTNIFNKAVSLFDFNEIPFPPLDKKTDPGKEWIKGVLLCALSSSVVLAINVILAIIAIVIAYTRSSDSDTHLDYAELYRGSCSITNGWTTGMHLVINFLSTILLAASNYSMQCLSAPSRTDIDRAHSKRTWLDIGVVSARNLWVMDARRKLLWMILFISSVPVHMMLVCLFMGTITAAIN